MSKSYDPEQTQQRILDAVIRLAHRIGIENVTLQKAAREAKVSYFAVHYHFNRENRDLGEAAIEHVANTAESLIEKRLSQAAADASADMLEAYIDAQFSWVETLPEYASLWLHYYYLCSAGQFSPEVRTQALHSARLRIRRILMESMGRGQLPPLKEVDSLVAKLHFQMLGALLTTVVQGKKAKHGGHRALTRDGMIALIGDHEAAGRQP